MVGEDRLRYLETSKIGTSFGVKAPYPNGKAETGGGNGRTGKLQLCSARPTDDQTWTGRQRRWCGTKRREETRRMMSGNWYADGRVSREVNRGQKRRQEEARLASIPRGSKPKRLVARVESPLLVVGVGLSVVKGDRRRRIGRHVRLLDVKESMAATASLAVGDLRQQPTAGMSEMTGAKESSVVAVKVSL
ncbi:hypothetical protein CSOJ01_06440 [Colletotrichum sojae]|uniref:Uncharacterized protein n=1 Tax=Colletotrichum sojae TaxID=2175907 RepID=A0A8H6JBV7_9PEZI|nr:hypothetical protein CSOJ01_06440 [Colletotrichum sojae]